MIYVLTDHDDNNKVSAVIISNLTEDKLQNVISEEKFYTIGYNNETIEAALGEADPDIQVHWVHESRVGFLEW